GERILLITILGPEEDPFTLPPGERRNDLPGGAAVERCFDVVVGRAEDHALVELVRGAGVPAEARGSTSRELCLQREQLSAQRPLAVERPGGRAPCEPEVEAPHFGLQARRGIIA